VGHPQTTASYGLFVAFSRWAHALESRELVRQERAAWMLVFRGRSTSLPESLLSTTDRPRLTMSRVETCRIVVITFFCQ
jgi:hypothetical protein